MSQVLVADDDESTRWTWGKILELEGHSVESARTGHEALAILQTRPPDLTLLDNRLPDILGLDILQKVYYLDQNIKIIIVTGYASMSEMRQAFKFGAVDFISKPVYDRALKQIVLEHLSSAPVIRRPPAEVGTRGYLDALPAIGPAARRWATLVAVVVRATSDTPTVLEWAKKAGSSESTIKQRCEAVDITAGDSLDFGRLYRLVARHSGLTWDLTKLLSVSGDRTVRRLVIERAHLNSTFLRRRPTLHEFLCSQLFVTAAELLAALQEVGLIRFGGHLSYGGYDVQTDGRHTQKATSASPVHR